MLFLATGIFFVLADLIAFHRPIAEGGLANSVWWTSFGLVYWLYALTAIYVRPVQALRFLKARARWAIVPLLAVYVVPLMILVYLTLTAWPRS